MVSMESAMISAKYENIICDEFKEVVGNFRIEPPIFRSAFKAIDANYSISGSVFGTSIGFEFRERARDIASSQTWGPYMIVKSDRTYPINVSRPEFYKVMSELYPPIFEWLLWNQL